MNLEAAHNFQLPALEVYDHFLNGLWLRILIQALQEASCARARLEPERPSVQLSAPLVLPVGACLRLPAFDGLGLGLVP